MPNPKRLAEYRSLVQGFKPNSGHLLAALHKVQHHYGYIPQDAVPVIGKQLEMTAAAVFGAITFYAEFRTTPPPRLLVNWCSGPACRLKGGEDIRRVFESVLEMDIEGGTPDGRIGLHLAQCEGSCQYAPLVWLRRPYDHTARPDGVLVDERGVVEGHLTVARAVEMARRLRDATEEAPQAHGQAHGEVTA